MAVKLILRHGTYEDFDQTKLEVAEPAVVTSGDPATDSGRSMYVSFGSGNVQRLSTAEEVSAEVAGQVAAQVIPAVDAAFQDAPHLQEVVIQATGDWLDEHPEATTTVQDGSITSLKLGSGAVTSVKIGGSAVTSAKIGSNAVITDKIKDEAVTTPKIKDGAVTDAKLATCNITDTDVRENIAQGETRATIFGKIKKWFTDLAPLLVTYQTDLSSDSNTYGITHIIARRRGNLVQIEFGGQSKNFSETGWKTITTLPEVFRPTYNVPYGTHIPQNLPQGKIQPYLVSVTTGGAFRFNPSSDNLLSGYINDNYWYSIN